MAIRVCNPKDFPYFIQHSKGKFGGLFGFLVENFIKDLKNLANITLDVRTKNDGIGQLVPATGAFDGCIGRLQRNESDVMMQLSTYPSGAEDIDQGKVITDQVIQYMTMYNVEEADSVQMESCFLSFSVGVWLLCIATLLAASGAVFAAHLLRERKPNERCLDSKAFLEEGVFYQVATHMTGYGELSSGSGAFNKVLYFTLSLFSFLVIFYFNSFIKTELVAARPPEIYRSYQDLLDHKVLLGFFKGFDSSFIYELAPEGSDEKKLWDLTLAKFSKDDILVIPQPKFSWVLSYVKSRKMVFILDSIFMPVMVRAVCTGVTDENLMNIFAKLFFVSGWNARTFFPFTGQDEKSELIMKGIITSKSFKGKIYNKLTRILGNLFETGYTEKMLQIVHESDFLGSIPGLDSQVKPEPGLIEECINNVVYVEDKQVNAVGLDNIRNLAPLCIFPLLIASYVLMYEIAKDRREKRLASARRQGRPRTS